MNTQPVYTPPDTPAVQQALKAIRGEPVPGVPAWLINIMEHDHIDRLAEEPPGSYRREPERVYLKMQYNSGVSLLDQYIWDNPLSMGSGGYEGAAHGATTGAESVVLDGMMIDSPEAVVEHLERVAFPALQAATAQFDEPAYTRAIINGEIAAQQRLGDGILKTGYAFISFPYFAYGLYGYVPYFSAYALYPDVIEKHFALQADLSLRMNRAAAEAYRTGNLPPLYRLDHDMADSRGTLVNVKSLDRIWFPHFARCIEPLLTTDVRLIWHCDGNLMEMVPRLLDAGLHGFQGFQYEDGMDYKAICRMRTRTGDPLTIIAGVSVTRTLPMGTPDDVRREMQFLVENGPPTGLFLGGSSSVAPGVPWDNIRTFVDGLLYYRDHRP